MAIAPSPCLFFPRDQKPRVAFPASLGSNKQEITKKLVLLQITKPDRGSVATLPEMRHHRKDHKAVVGGS
jgi:hypothetical protein